MKNINIPEKLYGRENEIETLNTLFNRIEKGEGLILTLPGFSGYGKTSLAQQLKRPVEDVNGIYISGKFEQYQQNIPYFAFRQALTDFCQLIELENADKKLEFRDDILQAVGNQGQVLTDLVPDFKPILGNQPELETVSPQEARFRLHRVIQNLFKAISTPEHPVVLFMDDWQWADTASLELLKQLQIGVDIKYLLLILSYRNNEVSNKHPFLHAIKDLYRNDIHLKRINVKGLTQQNVSEILHDSLKPETESNEQLAEIIYKRTKGNPFYIKSAIRYLVNFNMLWFENNKWKWNIRDAEQALPENVVDLFVRKMKQLDPTSQKLLSLAACLGNRFETDLLSIISEMPKQECLARLNSETFNEFVLPHFKKREAITSEKTEPDFFVFKHDRLQQAAYSLIGPRDLPHILVQIGRLLMLKLTPDQLESRLFEVVNRLNSGIKLITEKEELHSLCALNMRAARKAFAATAYNTALKYYRTIEQIIQSSGLQSYRLLADDETYRSYLKERAQCEFLEGNHQLAEANIAEAIKIAQNAVEKADAYTILIVQYTLQSRYSDAIREAKLALRELGVFLPDKDYEKASKEEIETIYKLLSQKNIASLEELPPMADPEMLMACKLLITMGPPCYRSHQKLWSVIVPVVVKLTIQYGNIPQVGYSHTGFGGLLAWVDNDFETAREFARLATNLMTKQFTSPSDQSVFYLMHGSSSRHWFEHLKTSSQDYTDAYQIGLGSGNLQYAAYAFGHNMYCMFYQGVNLKKLLQDTSFSLNFSYSRHNQWAIDLFEGARNVLKALTAENTLLAENTSWPDQDYLHTLDQHKNIQVKCIYNILKSFSLYWCGYYTQALKTVKETEPIIYSVGTQGLLPWPEFMFLKLLVLAKLFTQVESSDQQKWLKEILHIKKKLKIWAANCPENFRHKYLLACAEIERINKNEAKSIRLYSQATEEAQKNEFIQWEGLGYERIYDFWIQKGKEHLAYHFWKQAYICYSQWDAKAKINQMEASYREFLLNQYNTILPTDDASNVKSEKVLKEITEKHMNQVRNLALKIEHSKLRQYAVKQAEELAAATKNLREEVTHRKRTEIALRESEEQFHSLFANMAEGVALIEILENKDKEIEYRFADVNSSFTAITGWPRETVIGKRSSEIYRNSASPFLKHYKEVFLHKKPVYFETYFAPAKKHFAVSVVPWKGSGVANIFSDITSRIKAENEIKDKNRELEKLNADKDKFFSIISHDLKSPFNAIYGFSELLIGELKQGNVEKALKMAEVIKTSSNRAVELLMNLFEWSRAQRGALNFNPENLILKLVVDEVLGLFHEIAKNKNITISSEIPEDLVVTGDKSMINTVFRNLISNALKYTRQQGKIHIETLDVTQNQVTIKITDTGIGIKKENIKKIFNDAENFTTSGTDMEVGTGLGLKLCKEFIQKNNGQIWIESEFGKGTEIFFTLPVMKP